MLSIARVPEYATALPNVYVIAFASRANRLRTPPRLRPSWVPAEGPVRYRYLVQTMVTSRCLAVPGPCHSH